MGEFLTIDALGHRGDGVALTSTGRVFVPFALGGERVEVDGKSARRELIKVHEPSSDRVSPVCEYFGTCGGCQVQHLARQPYLDWKQNLVTEAIAQHNIETEVMPIVSFENGRRRRAVFTASHGDDGINFGFLEKSSHTIANISSCPVMSDRISTNIETIKDIVRSLLPRKGSVGVHVVDCENGLDIEISGSELPGESKRRSAVRRALEADIARLSYGGEILVEARRPILKMGIATVSPPPGTFVQAMKEVEQEMAVHIGEFLQDCKNVADLFCGVGTFALRLSQHSTVLACESDQNALVALDEAWRGTGGKLKSITCDKRDLYLRPVMVDELKKIQGVVFDPPRAGAEAQAKQLAGSKVRKIAAVSCNPVTLARDLVILRDGGFRIESITPIDQFLYTPHVEMVTLLKR